MKKLIIIFLGLLVSGCITIKAQLPEVSEKELKEDTNAICSAYKDVRVQENVCFRMKRETDRFFSCMKELEEYKTYLQKALSIYEKKYGERFKWKCTKSEMSGR